MHLRRSAAVLLAAAALASTGCQTKIDDRGLSQSVSLAVFDPAKSQIPLPNDLALAKIPDLAVAAGCSVGLPSAQAQFLCLLKAGGGFPGDQEVPVTFSFARQSLDASAAVVTDPVALDTTTVKPYTLGATDATVAVFDVTNAPTIVPVKVDASFDAATSTLSLRKPAATDGSRRWTPGHRYVAFVRGGASGVKTTDGAPVDAMPTMFVLREAIISDRDLTIPANQSLLPGTAEEKAAAGAQLEPIRQGYRPLKTVFEAFFGPGTFGQVANMLTFTISPAQVVVEVDKGKGSAPLPIDLLRAPDAAGGLILDNPAYGAARAGIVTLDGFSTTAPITAPVTGGVGAIDAGTVNGQNVFLFEVGAATTLLSELKYASATGGTPAAAAAAYVAQPPGTYLPAGSGTCPASTGGCATTIVLQPAVAVSASGPFLPPLKGNTKYAVVVTKRVKDVAGKALGRSTAARLILELAAPVDTSIGVDAGTAALLNQMRTDLAPVWAALPAGTTKADVAMAYVFKTQTTVTPSLGLSALPYKVEATLGAAAFSPKLATSVTSSYPDVTGAAAIYQVVIPTIDVTSHVTGALDPAVLGSATLMLAHATAVRALVAVPAGVTGARPLVVFGHGLTGSKESLVTTTKLLPGTTPPVNALLAKGFIVAAIDFPQHGERAWCLKNADCATGTCVAFTTPAGAPAYQGDVDPATGTPVAPGTCSNNDPLPTISGQTFVSANFFRTRDTFRQNLLDQSALVLALARPPTAPQPAANPLAAALTSLGVGVHPGQVYWEGISLGGIAGTQVLATNPRFSRGVASVAGGTLVDVFTHSPSFAPYLAPLFTGLLHDQLAAAGQTAFDPAMLNPASASYLPAVAAAYGKTLLVAKWILDPGDALNFARHVKRAPLPNLLADPTGATAQAAKDVLGQVATNDQTIPNDSNYELFVNGGFDTVQYTSSAYPASAMHGILGFQPRVQADAAAYLEAKTMPTAPYSIP